MSTQEELGYIIPYISNTNVVHESGMKLTINDPIITRVLMFIMDGDWEKADEYTEKLLDKAPEDGLAYLCKLMIEFKVCSAGELFWTGKAMFKSPNYIKFIAFGDRHLKVFLAEQALDILCTGAFTFAKDVEQKCIEYADIIKYVEASKIALKNIRIYYDILTKTQGAYLNNEHFTRVEATTIATLVNIIASSSTYEREKTVIASLLQYATYPEELLSSEIFSLCMIQQSNEFLQKHNYYAACDILTFVPTYQHNKKRIPDQAHRIIENLSYAHGLSSQKINEYKSLAIAEMLRYSISDKKTYDLVYNSLKSFQLNPSIIILSVQRLAAYNPSAQDLDAILLENANRLPNGNIKTQCLKYANELKEQKERQKEEQIRSIARENKNSAKDFICLMVVLGAAIWGLITGYNTITYEVDYNNIHPWIFVFFITFAIMAMFTLLSRRYKKIAAVISCIGAGWQCFSWFYICCDYWFFEDPGWIAYIVDFLGEFFPPFLFAAAGAAGILYVVDKIYNKYFLWY